MPREGCFASDVEERPLRELVKGLENLRFALPFLRHCPLVDDDGSILFHWPLCLRGGGGAN